MTKTFRMDDIAKLKEVNMTDSKRFNELPEFLNEYTFDDVYETQDNSICFDNDVDKISIEVINMFDVYNREVSVMYHENGKPCIMEL